MILPESLLLVAVGFVIASIVLKRQTLKARWRRYQEARVVDHGQRIENARAKVQLWETRVQESWRALRKARSALAQIALDGAADGLVTPEGQEAETMAASRSAASDARAEALRLQREDYATAVSEKYPPRWLGWPERFARKSLSELWRGTGLCIACGVRPVRDSWHAHCYETCAPRRRSYSLDSLDDKRLPDLPPPALRTEPPTRAEAIAMIQLKEEENRRKAEARKWPECASCGEIFRRRSTRRHCLRCRPPGTSGIRAHLPTLIRQQGSVCGICKTSLPNELEDIQVDHIIPRAHGGTDVVDNLQATHARCNLSKGAKLGYGQPIDEE